jgi:hypothetical protein
MYVFWIEWRRPNHLHGPSPRVDDFQSGWFASDMKFRFLYAVSTQFWSISGIEDCRFIMDQPRAFMIQSLSNWRSGSHTDIIIISIIRTLLALKRRTSNRFPWYLMRLIYVPRVSYMHTYAGHQRGRVIVSFILKRSSAFRSTSSQDRPSCA